MNATIGQALLPVAEVLSGVLRELAGVVDPIAKQLAPILGKLANLLGDVFVAVAELSAALDEALMPILDVLVDALEPLVAIIRVVAAALATLVQAFKPVIDLFVQLAIQPFVDALKFAVKALILFAAQLAVLFGQKAGLDQLIANLTKKPGGTANAAPTNPGIRSLEQISKDIQTGSFLANGTGGERKPDDFIKDIAEDLRAIAGGRGGLAEAIGKACAAALRDANPLREHDGDSGFVKGAKAVGRWTSLPFAILSNL